MGVEFCAIMDHHMTESEIHRLPELFNSPANPIEIFQQWFCKTYESRDADPGGWRWDDPWEIGALNELWKEGDSPKLLWFKLIWMRVYRKTIVLETRKGWYWFTGPEEPLYRENLRAACRNLAALLASRSALYVPDNAKPESIAWELADEHCVNELIALLKKECGPPAPTIPSIYIDLGESLYDTSGYFIDHFQE